MTGYHISVGYLSGSSGHIENRWELLKQLANNITLVELKQEYLSYELPMPQEELAEYLVCYSKKDDATIRLDDELEEIRQCASGGEPERKIKEGLRRAFCRLMLKKAHENKLEINISVS